MNYPEFTPFPKIKRFYRDIVITEKVDGSNASIFIPEDKDYILAGSRTRWLSTEKGQDNYGFASWVEQNREELFKLGPGHHFGEWYGLSINRGYGLFERRFALFNVFRWSDPASRPNCCGVVPTLYDGPLVEEEIERTIRQLENNGSSLVPGYKDPEGICIYHKASGTLYKYTFGGDGHKALEKLIDKTSGTPMSDSPLPLETNHGAS